MSMDVRATGSIIIRTTRQGHYQFQFLSGEGECLLSGEPRDSRDRAMKDARALRGCVPDDGSYAVSRDGQGRFFFHFMGDRGEVLGTSGRYPTPEGLGRAIAALKADAPQALLVDKS